MVVDVAVEGDRIGDAEPVSPLHEPLVPPAATHDVQVQIRDAGAKCGHRVKRVLNLLVRHQPRQHHDAGRRRPLRGKGVGRRLVEAVAHHGDPRGVDPEVGQVAGRRQGDGDVLVAAVHAGRQP